MLAGLDVPDQRQAEGFLAGTSVVGRSSAWFFSDTSPGFQPSGVGADGSGLSSPAEEASAFVGGGLGGGVASSGATGVSSDVRELRWSRMEGSDDMKACLVSVIVVGQMRDEEAGGFCRFSRAMFGVTDGDLRVVWWSMLEMSDVCMRCFDSEREGFKQRRARRVVILFAFCGVLYHDDIRDTAS